MTVRIFLILISYISTEWKAYTNCGYPMDFAVREDTVFIATNGGIRYFNPGDIEFSGNTFVLQHSSCFTSVNGLPKNIITQIEIDSKGGLWTVVKDQGIYVKPPGESNFFSYELPFQSIKNTRSLKTQSNFLFVGTNDGLFVVETKGDYSVDNDQILPPQEILDTVKYFCEDNDTIYITTGEKVYYWSSGSVSEFTLPYISGSLTAFAKEGNIYAYGTGDEVVFVSGDSIYIYHTGKTYNLQINKDTVYAATYSGLLSLYSQAMDSLITITTTSFVVLDSIIVYGAYFYSENYYEIGSGLRIIKNGQNYREEQDVYFNRYTSIRMGQDGKLWGGILTWKESRDILPSKLIYLQNDSLFTVDSLYQRDRAVRSLSIDAENNIWCGTFSTNGQGIIIYNSDGQFIERITELPSLIVCHIYTGNDTLIALFQDGIYQLHKNGNGYTYSLLYSVDYPTWVEPDGDGKIWIGTENNGVLVVDKNGSLLFHFTETDFGTPLINVIKHHKGITYIGTGNGLYQYNGTLTKLCTGGTRDIEFYKKYVWALQDSALRVLTQDGKVVKSFNAGNSPFIPMETPFYKVRDVLEIDSLGNLWVAGEEGLFYVKVDYGLQTLTDKLYVYPNPATKGELVYIENADRKPIVYTLDLRKIKIELTREGTHFILNTRGLERGLYIIQVPGKKPAKLFIK